MLLINQKIKTLCLIILCNSLGYTVSFGQQTWEQTYGGNHVDFANVVQQTTDGGYIVGGSTKSFGLPEMNMYLVKTDANGDTTWTRNYSGTFGSTSDDVIRDLQQTADGGYILVATSNITVGLLIRSTYVIKTDNQGTVQWSQSYMNTGTSAMKSISQTGDGGYIMAGGVEQVEFAKIDSIGNVLWLKTYGDNFYESSANAICETTDGGYILGGYFRKNSVHQYGIIKTDIQGDTLWTHSYPFIPFCYGGIQDVKQTPDGGYIAVGYQDHTAGNFNYGIMFKTDANGVLEWGGLDTNIIGVTTRLAYHSVDITQDGAYVYTGDLTKPNLPNNTIFQQNNFLLLGKRDTNGNTLWERSYIGGFSGRCIQETASKHLIVSGGTRAYGAGTFDMYVILTDSLGLYRTRTIQGNIYQDLDLSCNQTSGDRDLSGTIVQASLNSNPSLTYYGTTDAAGYYVIPCPSGIYTIDLPNLHPYYDLSCPQSTGIITGQPYDTIDFPLEVLALCPIMNVDVSAPLLRQIVPSTYSIQYCNIGTDTAHNVELTIQIDTFLNILNFSQTPTSQLGNSYTFNIGTVDIGDCGNLYITVQVDSTAILGQTHCLEVSITPDSLCLPNNWTGMLLDVNGTCQNDSIHFNIENQNTVGLSTPRSYWVFEDNIIMRTGTVTVPNGGTSTIVVPALPRKFYRIEVAQEPGIPWTVSDSIISAFVEGCVPDGSGEFNVGFPTQFPNGHAPTFRAIDCQQNIGSYDPNNKEAQPVGYDAEHYINQNQYIDYKINFQNTGTDTAFFVTLIDTLSPYLDPASVQLTSASHPYTWRVKNNGVLEVKFDYIMLPDSNVNEPASHGFAKFRIEQKANNPVGTIINNFADIYFDLNIPVGTNTTYHEIGANFYVLSIVPLETATGVEVNAFPNPFTYGTTIQVEGEEYDHLTLIVYDVMGRQVAVLSEENTNEIELPRNNLGDGVYVFKLVGNGKPISSGKIIAQ